MLVLFIRRLFITIAVLATNVVSAENVFISTDEFKKVTKDGIAVLHFKVDNDSLLLNKDDSFYTSGMQISFKNVLNTAYQSVAYGWQFGQDLYTASDIKLQPTEISSIDHPYAGWVYSGIFRESTDVSGFATRIGVDIGCLGACAGGEQTQTLLHRLLKQPLPQGWRSQLKQEWGVVLTGELSPAKWQIAENIDIQTRGKAHFGNIFTDLSFESILRFGQLNSLPEQLVNCGFLRTEIKAIGYNATLQGGYFNNQANTPDLQRSVGELELGYQFRSRNYGVFTSFIRRSSEIRNLSNNYGAQNFIRLQFIYQMK